MKKYELMTITKKALGQEGSEVVSGLVKEAITKLEGSVDNISTWGRRKFAYKMDNETEGYYEVIDFSINPSKIEALKTRINLIEGLQRYLITNSIETKREVRSFTKVSEDK
jgi:small subunit ribosomal protein S6